MVIFCIEFYSNSMEKVKFGSRSFYVPMRSMVVSVPLFTKFTLAGQLFVKNSYKLRNVLTTNSNTLVSDSMSQEWWTDERTVFLFAKEA